MESNQLLRYDIVNIQKKSGYIFLSDFYIGVYSPFKIMYDTMLEDGSFGYCMEATKKAFVYGYALTFTFNIWCLLFSLNQVVYRKPSSQG